MLYGEGNGSPLQYFCGKISRTEEPSRLWSMGLQRVGQTKVTAGMHAAVNLQLCVCVCVCVCVLLQL